MELVQLSVTMAGDAMTRFPLDTLQMISFPALSYKYKLSIKPLETLKPILKTSQQARGRRCWSACSVAYNEESSLLRARLC